MRRYWLAGALALLLPFTLLLPGHAEAVAFKAARRSCVTQPLRMMRGITTWTATAGADGLWRLGTVDAKAKWMPGWSDVHVEPSIHGALLRDGQRIWHRNVGWRRFSKMSWQFRPRWRRDGHWFHYKLRRGDHLRMWYVTGVPTGEGAPQMCRTDQFPMGH